MPSAGLISLRDGVSGGEVRGKKGGSKSANEQPLHNRVKPKMVKGGRMEGCGDELFQLK